MISLKRTFFFLLLNLFEKLKKRFRKNKLGDDKKNEADGKNGDEAAKKKVKPKMIKFLELV